MRALTTSHSASRDDRGRWAALAAVVWTAAVAAYVFVTFRNLSPLVPLSASLLALCGSSGRAAVARRTIAMIIVFLFAEISMASIGMFFIPAIVALVVSVARSDVREIN